MQSEISLQDFQDAEPDVLVHSTPAIVERFSEKGISCNVALKALCKKKGLDIEVKNESQLHCFYDIKFLVSVNISIKNEFLCGLFICYICSITFPC